jgi:hypothetical protein
MTPRTFKQFDSALTLLSVIDRFKIPSARKCAVRYDNCYALIFCDHEDTDDYSCLTCGEDMTEDRMAQAYDRAKDFRKYGDT